MIGMFQGHRYKQLRLCDVFPHLGRSRHYFLCDAEGRPTGDHFRTLRELRAHVRSLSPAPPPGG